MNDIDIYDEYRIRIVLLIVSKTIENKVMNVVLNVFIYRDKLPECFLTSDFPTDKFFSL